LSWLFTLLWGLPFMIWILCWSREFFLVFLYFYCEWNRWRRVVLLVLIATDADAWLFMYMIGSSELTLVGCFIVVRFCCLIRSYNMILSVFCAFSFLLYVFMSVYGVHFITINYI
jgi:hypothetical protein